MSLPEVDAPGRHVRTGTPVQAEFGGTRFTAKEFIADLSQAGVFLPTELIVEPRTEGTLTFRATRYEEPFTVRAEVAVAFPPGNAVYGGEPGLGVMLKDLTPTLRDRLDRMVDGTRDGSIVESIRRAVREGTKSLEQQLRGRPTDQKLMLAMQAEGPEIDALLKDGNPVVVTRLLQNPRLQIPHVRAMTRDARLTTPILLAVGKKREWIEDDEILFNFCKHPKAPRHEVKRRIVNLSLPKIRELILAPGVHPEVRAEAKKFSRGR